MSQLRSVLFAFFLLIVAAPLSGNQGCVFRGFPPTAMVGSIEHFASGTEESLTHDWFARLVGADTPTPQDNSPSYSLPIFSLGAITEYRFQVGPAAATDCANSANYSTWRPVTETLQLDVSSIAGVVKLCLLGKGSFDGGPWEQAAVEATQYLWERQAASVVTVLKDHITNSVNWQDGKPVASYWTGSAIRTSAVAAFTGNGEKIARVGVLFGVRDGAGNPNAVVPDPDWAVTFYSSYGDFASTLFSLNDALPQTKVFDDPTNSDWLTVVGTSSAATGLLQYRYAEFDVTGEDWFTTDGALQGIAILPYDQPGGNVSFAMSNGSNAIGTELDWYVGQQGSTTFGPNTLQSFNGTQPFVAFRVETVR